jgi:hypothetical protein
MFMTTPPAAQGLVGGNDATEREENWKALRRFKRDYEGPAGTDRTYQD